MKKLNFDQIRLDELYLQDGMSSRKLAKIYGCSKPTILTNLKKSKNEDVLNKLKNNRNV